LHLQIHTRQRQCFGRLLFSVTDNVESHDNRKKREQGIQVDFGALKANVDEKSTKEDMDEIEDDMPCLFSLL
jgi:hypothetical protein